MPLTTIQSGMMDSVAQYYGFKNRIINGAMGIWQRGTTGTSGYSSVDRWVGINTTSMNRSTDVPSGFQYSLEFGNASATYIIVDQRIEANNCIDLIGQKITVSFWAKNVSGASWIGVELYYANAVDNFSGITMFAANTWLSPSSSWTQYTFTTPSTVPASAANGIVVRVYRNTDTASTTRVTGVQLEKGSTATSFDYRPYGTELQLCQRYLPCFNANISFNGTAAPIGSTFSASATVATVLCKLPVTTRVPPTGISVSSNSHFTLNQSGVGYAPTLTMGFGGIDASTITITVASGLSAGAGGYLYASNSAGQIQFTGCEL